MDSKTPSVVIAFLGVAVAAVACQMIAGVEDKQLDPGMGADAGTPDHDAAPDAVADTTVESSDDVVIEDGPQEVANEDSGPDYARRPPARTEPWVPIDAGLDAGDSGTGKTLTFVARRLYVGSIDPETNVTTYSAWRSIGYDVDGLCTTLQQSQQDTSGVCKMPAAGNKASHEDGDLCRDNVVGHLIGQVLELLAVDFEADIHARTQSGVAQSLMIQIFDVDEGPDDAYAPARMYATAPTQFPPTWKGTDVIPVDRESVLNDDVEQPKYTLTSGYIKDNVWVSGDFNASPMIMPMMVLDRVAEVNAATATLAIHLDAAHEQSTRAMFSAVMDLMDLEPLLRFTMMEATYCNSGLVDQGLNGYFLPSKDLASSGPDFVDPNAECGLQSFGVQMDLVRVKPPTTAVQVQPSPTICDGGT